MGSVQLIPFRRFGFLLACVLTIGNSTFATAIGQTKNEPKEIWLGDVLGDGDLIKYRGYVLTKRHRSVVDPEIALKPIDVSYAVLKRRGKRLMKFDGNVYFGAGNSTSFGLITLLDNEAKQAIISQDVFRGGKQWIVTLSRRPRIIFDGDAWSVGREGNDLGIVDLDGDGVYEISVPICIFYGFESLSPAATPLPSIVFKYSRRSSRYLPANPEFAKHVLAGIEDRKTNIHPTGSPPDDMNHLGDVLGVVLDYVFAGRAREAWAFYDAAYELPDKNKIKKAIRAELRHSPVYKFIYSKRTRQRTRRREFEGK